jgi:hypothetical protein
MGGGNSHTFYCRYNGMCKKVPIPDGMDVPDLDELIKRALSDGTLTRTNKKGGASKDPATPNGKGTKRKADDTPVSAKAKAVKLEEDGSELDAEGEDVSEEASEEASEEIETKEELAA